MRPKNPQLAAWEQLLLAAACVVPVFGGGGLLLLLICGLVILVGHSRQRFQYLTPSSPEALAFIAVVAFYIGYFYILSIILTGDIWTANTNLWENVPLLYAAFVALFLPPNSNLSPARIGNWATRATLVIGLLSLLSYWGTYQLKIGQSTVFKDIWYGDELRFFSKNPLIFSICLSLLSFLSLLGLKRRAKRELFMAITAITVTVFVLMFLSRGRGPTLTAILTLSALLFFFRPSPMRLIRIFLSLALAIGTLFLLSEEARLLYSQFTIHLWEGFSSLMAPAGHAEYSTGIRLLMYEAASEAWRSSPWFGYGYENRFTAILPYLDQELPQEWNDPHQALLNHMVAGGIFGLIAFLAFAFLPLIILFISGKSGFDARVFAMVFTLVTLANGMTTSVMGHFIHATSFATLLLLFLAMLRSQVTEYSTADQRL